MSTRTADFSEYLFVHFTGEHPDGEQVYFSYSDDGLHWTDLNGGLPVLRSEIGEGGVRDPFLVRSPLDGRFYLLATDLRIANGKGWASAVEQGSRDIVVWDSSDLVTWSQPRAITLGLTGAGCVWAPEAVFDPASGDFLVFWASATLGSPDGPRKQKIYQARTKDFCAFSPAELYIERDNHIIDTTIIRQGDRYFRYSKDETTKNIRVDSGLSLAADAFSPLTAPVLEALTGVEGPEIYPLPRGQGWCLIVDRFAAGLGYLPLVSSDLSSGVFRVLAQDEFDFGQTRKRHGGVLPITPDEGRLLFAAFGDKK